MRIGWLAAVGITGATLTGGAGLTGCAGGEKRITPPGAMIDNTVPIEQRRTAARQVWNRVDEGVLSQTRAQELLKEVAWRPGADPALRLSAVRQLADPRADQADTERVFGLMLPTRVRPPYSALQETRIMADTAAARGWTSMTVPLVRSWSYPFSDDLARPERMALETLHPGEPLADVVWRVFTGEADESLRERDRRDAWGLLMRIDPDGRRIASLATDINPTTAAGETDAMLQALASTRAAFDAVPLTSAQFEWAERLQTRENADFLREARASIDAVPPVLRSGHAMRHASPIVWATRHRPGWLGASRDELLAEAQTLIEPRRQVWRSEDAVNSGVPNESIARNGDRLVWGDALLTAIAARIPDNSALGAAACELADRDLIDSTTEYGGIIDATESGSLELLAYPPRVRDRVNDDRFVASLDMLRRGDTALFHFHMQAQRHRNDDYAGPSLADVQYAERHGRACVVFTFVNRDSLNIDVYFPNGVAIDLGSVDRPAGSPGP